MLKEESILFVRFFLFAIVVLGVFVSGVAVLIIYQCLFSFSNFARRPCTKTVYFIFNSSAASK